MKLMMSDNNHFAEVPSKLESEVAREIVFLQSPFGDESARREHDRAAEFLLEHAGQAHPQLLKLLQSNSASNPYAVIEILPRFGLPESIPVMGELLSNGPPNLAGPAARALAFHPLGDARTVLLRGLNSSRNETVIAAADALLIRSDRSACAELGKVIGHADPDVRYHVLSAAGVLGCLDRETLVSISKRDGSDLIRELVSELIAAASKEGNR